MQQAHWTGGKFLRMRCQKHTEHSLSPSANSDYLLENEFCKRIIWKRTGFRPILSPKENLIWTFYTEFRPENSILPDPNLPRAISAQSRASPARHPGPPLEREQGPRYTKCAGKGWRATWQPGSGMRWWNEFQSFKKKTPFNSKVLCLYENWRGRPQIVIIELRKPNT